MDNNQIPDTSHYTHSGFFLTLEGGEGAGKSTQAKRLAEAMAAKGWEVMITREPGGTPGAEEIRNLLLYGNNEHGSWHPMTSLLLLLAARQEHLHHVIIPALQAGKFVICDRYVDSTIAYQGFATNLSIDMILDLHSILSGFVLPDLTVILDIPASQGVSRSLSDKFIDKVHDRTNDIKLDQFEKQDMAFHERLKKGYLIIAENSQGNRVKVIDANQSIENITQEILALIAQKKTKPTSF